MKALLDVFTVTGALAITGLLYLCIDSVILVKRMTSKLYGFLMAVFLVLSILLVAVLVNGGPWQPALILILLIVMVGWSLIFNYHYTEEEEDDDDYTF